MPVIGEAVGVVGLFPVHAVGVFVAAAVRVIIAGEVEVRPVVGVLGAAGNVTAVGLDKILLAGILVVIVYHVEVTAFAAIAAIPLPVVVDAVAVIHIAAEGGGGLSVTLIQIRMVKTGGTVGVAGQEVVVEGSVLAAPDAAVAVVSLAVEPALFHGLCNNAPLQGHVGVGIEGGGFVNAPAHGAVIQDDIFVVAAPDAVFAVGLSILDIGLAPVAFVSKTEAHKADNHIVRIDVGGVVLDADAVSGGRLAGNGDVSLGNLEVRRQLDGPSHVKDNGAGAAGLDGCAEGTGSLVIEVGHMDDLSATAAGGVHAAALGSGESTGHAVFLRRGNGEVLILDTRRDRAGTGRRLPCRAGIQEGIGRFSPGVHGLHAKAVVSSLGKAFHLDITAFHRAALYLAAGLGKRP